MKENIIIYDKRTNDNLYATSLFANYLYKTKNIDCTLYNYDEVPFDTKKDTIYTIREKFETITICGLLFDEPTIYLLHNALQDKLLVIQSNTLYYNKYKKISESINVMYKTKHHSIQNDYHFILNYMQSLTYTVYEYINKDVDINVIPNIIKYIDSFVNDSYIRYGLTRDTVIEADKYLNEKYQHNIINYLNNYNNITDEFNDWLDTTDIETTYVTPNVNAINKYIMDSLNYIDKIEVSVDYNKKGIILFTHEKLAQDIILNNEIFLNYDCIITLNPLNNDNWKMCVYNVFNSTDLLVLDFENNMYTLKTITTMFNNSWNAASYIHDNYNGVGNNICGVTVIDKYKFKEILFHKKI
jgi:hypothetical protein